MSAALGALIIAGAIFIGRLAARVLRPPGGSARSRGPAQESGDRDGAGPSFAAFPCKLGDVIVRRFERDEAWLAGALLFAEERPVAALFVAPEAAEDRALFVRDGSRDVAWLSPLPSGVSTPGTEPPNSIEHRGARFERRRRLPVRVEVWGVGAPVVGSRAIVAEYVGPGADRIMLVAGTNATLAWQGISLTEDQYDVLPGDSSTMG